jgi:hypothetical protein
MLISWRVSAYHQGTLAMRLGLAASGLCLSLLLIALPATSQVPAPSSGAPSSAAGDAAVRHAKRTACLKESKARKLVGAEKTAFLKNCIDAPPESISASRQTLPDRP